jgi:monoamine oxidase|tara:strand:+ start:564 stop:1919 length:1356 start_codon:yes stop_codon:yes gene_type:complete
LRKIFLRRTGRRQFLKASLSGLALAALPRISFAQPNPDVVVIGAGSAGLSATAELMRRNISVLCIEGMNRIGGRCYTDMLTFGVPADIGGHWLHGFSANQIAEFGKKHKDKFKIYKDPDRSVVYDGRSKVSGKELWKLYKKIKEIKNTRTSDKPLIDLIPEKIKKNSWFDTVHKIVDGARDLGNYTAGDDHANWSDAGIGDGLCREGYGTLLAYYRKDVTVKLNTIVNEIKWGGKGVQVVTNKGTINAKACIVTVSVGVLRAEKIKFTPALPLKKYEAFEGITMNTSNRVLIQLKKKFLGKFKNDTYLYTKCNSNGAKSPKTFYGFMKMSGTNLCLFGTSGQFSKDLENEGSEAMIDFVVNDLKSTFGSKFYEKYFIKAMATGWANNPFTLGAYSGAIPGKALLRRELRRHEGDRVFFAGEATANAFQTVHGADLSGKRVATDLYISPALD